MEDSLAGMGHNWKISEAKNLCGNRDEPQGICGKDVYSSKIL